jgi:magnesium transporter
MLSCYKIQDGALTEAPSSDAPDILWYDIYNPTTDEDKFVESKLSIVIPTREELEEIELSSRLYLEDDAEFMTMNVISHADQPNPVRTPVTFIIKNNILVTIRYDEPKSFVLFKARASRPHSIAHNTGEFIFLNLLESIVNRIADLFEKTGADIDGISCKVFHRKNINANKIAPNLHDIIGDIGYAGDVITMLQDSLMGLSRAITYHAAVSKNLSKESSQYVKMLQRDAISLSEHAVSLSDKTTFLLDATLGLINLEQNQIIKMFSVATVVFLPPTLVASVYGMNFKYMPELEWVTGYPFALGLMAIAAIIPYLLAKRRGWL